MTPLDTIFNNLFQIIPYDFWVGAMGAVIIFEFFYTLFEAIDML